jgi:hypothetical protein
MDLTSWHIFYAEKTAFEEVASDDCANLRHQGSMLWSQFSAIFSKKLAFFLNTNVMINFFSEFSFVLSQKRHFFRKMFRRKYLKNHNIGPRIASFSWYNKPKRG